MSITATIHRDFAVHKFAGMPHLLRYLGRLVLPRQPQPFPLTTAFGHPPASGISPSVFDLSINFASHRKEGPEMYQVAQAAISSSEKHGTLLRYAKLSLSIYWVQFVTRLMTLCMTLWLTLPAHLSTLSLAESSTVVVVACTSCTVNPW